MFRIGCVVLALSPAFATPLLTQLSNGYILQSEGGLAPVSFNFDFPLALTPGAFERVDWENYQVDDVNIFTSHATIWADNTVLATATGGIVSDGWRDDKWSNTFIVPAAASYRMNITGSGGLQYFTLNQFAFTLSDPPLPIPEPSYALPLLLIGWWFCRLRPCFR